MTVKFRILLSLLLLLALSQAESPASVNFFQTPRQAHESFVRMVAKGWIRFFQKFISPYDGGQCGFRPTCSEYARRCFAQRGFSKGWVMAADRLQRCHPRRSVGYYRMVDGHIVDDVWENQGVEMKGFDLFSGRWILPQGGAHR